MAEADWDSKTVIGYRRSATSRTVSAEDAAKAKRSGASVNTEKKALGGKNLTSQGPDFARIAKLDRDNEVSAPETIDRTVGQSIAKARQELEPKLTQKQLAQQANETLTVIQSYENGTAVPSPQVLAKLERILKVKLRGKNIGEPVEPKGKAAKAATK